MKVFDFEHSNLDEAFQKRLVIIRAIIEKFKENKNIRFQALQILKSIGDPPRYLYDYLASLAIFNYLKRKIPFRKDIYGVETIQFPEHTLKYGGDCDCSVSAAGSYLESVGVKTLLGVSKQNNSNIYNHIFLYIPSIKKIFDLTNDKFPVDLSEYTKPEIYN